MADSLDMDVLFRQSRYEQDAPGDYLNAPFDKESYDAFIAQLVAADRVIKRDFETKDLFQACQPIEEIARKGADAPVLVRANPWGSLIPQRVVVRGRRCSFVPRTPRARLTIWWAFRPISHLASRSASSA